MGKITKNDVLKLAKLSKLSLTDSELEEFTKEISSILDYVEQLQTVDIGGLEPTQQVTGLVNVSRTDTVIDYGYNPHELLHYCDLDENNLIKVKRMII